MDKLNFKELKRDFPILNQRINDEPLIYLDNAATSQMPLEVEAKINLFNNHDRANVHRGVHSLGLSATNRYEAVRQKVAQFIGAKKAKEIVFTSGCTDSLNLISATYGEANVNPGDEIIVSIMEHHSNLIPWQQLAKRSGAKLKFIELSTDGRLDLDDAKSKITSKTKIVAVTHVSNVLGTVNPIRQLSTLTHEKGAVLIVDGAQAVGHFPIDVTKLGADFYAFSGHKMFAPTGVGVLYGKEELLEKMPPYRFGGEMIANVTRAESIWAPIPQKFEAGTPNISGVIGLGAAIDYLNALDLKAVEQHERELTAYALNELQKVKDLQIYGPLSATDRTGVISFNLKGIHPHDVATALDLNGIEVRAGHHCAQPLMESLGVESTVRGSFSIYNTKEDINKLVNSLQETRNFFNEFR